MGFAADDITPKLLFSYEDIKGEPLRSQAKIINPYLVEGPNLTLFNRRKPLCSVPRMGVGNQPIDGGNYLFTTEERNAFLSAEPHAKAYFYRWIGTDEFLYGYERWCLWLGDCTPAELQSMPEAMKRVKRVQEKRLLSRRKNTLKLASTPTRFEVEFFPERSYLVVPEVSSERRYYVPIGFEKPTTLSSNLVKVVPDASLYHFGVLSSIMHNTWIPHYQERCHPSQSQTRGLDGAEQCVVTARRSRLMSEGG